MQSESKSNVHLVIPCFNESGRWKESYWRYLADLSDLRLLFVDDGSLDETCDVVRSTCQQTGSRLIPLATNIGKGEAIRRGLLEVIGNGASTVGYLDADAAFPASEIERLSMMAAEHLDNGAFDALWSSRVMLSGRDITRKPFRHYVGRGIATIVAPWHGHVVYDTQSGFKLFRVSPILRACLSEPFRTRWLFEIELLQRWHQHTGGRMRIWEEPISGWRDVPGSNVNAGQSLQILRDLTRVFDGRNGR